MKSTEEMIEYFKGVRAQHEAVLLTDMGKIPFNRAKAEANINAYNHVLQKLEEWDVKSERKRPTIHKCSCGHFQSEPFTVCPACGKPHET